MMLRTLGCVAATLIAVQAGLASAAAGSRDAGDAKQFWAEPGRTGKERLSGKAADEQRVDNCKVPLNLRGAKPRPDDCRHETSSGSKR